MIYERTFGKIENKAQQEQHIDFDKWYFFNLFKIILTKNFAMIELMNRLAINKDYLVNV